MHWYPLVTFWQVAADLALAAAVPAGHGHTYGMLQGASSWAAIIPPAGWTADRTAALGKPDRQLTKEPLVIVTPAVGVDGRELSRTSSWLRLSRPPRPLCVLTCVRGA